MAKRPSFQEMKTMMGIMSDQVNMLVVTIIHAFVDQIAQIPKHPR